MMEQQEGSPNSTTAGKSFEKNCILHGYYFVFTMKARFVKIYEFSLPSPYNGVFPGLSQSMHCFSNVSETNCCETPRQSWSAHA